VRLASVFFLSKRVIVAVTKGFWYILSEGKGPRWSLDNLSAPGVWHRGGVFLNGKPKLRVTQCPNLLQLFLRYDELVELHIRLVRVPAEHPGCR
jgi:hypothetical protein